MSVCMWRNLCACHELWLSLYICAPAVIKVKTVFLCLCAENKPHDDTEALKCWELPVLLSIKVDLVHML